MPCRILCRTTFLNVLWRMSISASQHELSAAIDLFDICELAEPSLAPMPFQHRPYIVRMPICMKHRVAQSKLSFIGVGSVLGTQGKNSSTVT